MFGYFGWLVSFPCLCVGWFHSFVVAFIWLITSMFLLQLFANDVSKTWRGYRVTVLASIKSRLRGPILRMLMDTLCGLLWKYLVCSCSWSIIVLTAPTVVWASAISIYPRLQRIVACKMLLSCNTGLQWSYFEDIWDNC